MDVEYTDETVHISRVLNTLLHEFSSITDYRTLRASVPERLIVQLRCAFAFLYIQHDEHLELVASSCERYTTNTPNNTPAHHPDHDSAIETLSIYSGTPEAYAWRERRQISTPAVHPISLATPLIYRQRSIGVLVVQRGQNENGYPDTWSSDEQALLDAIASVLALLLENSRLLERDRERIYELSLLNSISNQMNHSLYDIARLRSIVLQRVREIAHVDICALIETTRDAELPNWLAPELWTQLVQQAHERHMFMPFLLETTDEQSPAQAIPTSNIAAFRALLPAETSTFFAMPLYGVRTTNHSYERTGPINQDSPATKLLGMIVAAYYRPWKMRREELTLLQILSNQVSAAWENMLLMEEVIAARNESHRLLLQVLDDQRTNALILESVPSGLFTTDQDGRITTFNRSAATTLGYHPYEVLGLSVHKVLPSRSQLESNSPERGSVTISTLPYRRYILTEPNDETTGTDIWHGTIITEDRYNRKLVLDVDMTILYNDRGERVGTLTTFNDMTSMHQLEEEKRRLDRLASLGKMAANVAHEVRNPLASIKTAMQMIRDDLQQGPSPSPDQDNWMQDSVDVVLKEVERLDRLVRDLLLFARPRQLHRVRCDLISLCDQVLNLLRPEFQELNIDLHRVYEAVPSIWVDIGQIEQVLLNIYKNALQAMPEGGIITIACRCIDILPIAHNQRFPHTFQQQQTGPYAQWIELIVSDTGTGMTPDQLTLIFQPFYTTKAHGIGLGLPITRRLIEDHGGSLHIESQFGYGTTVTIHLPVLVAENTEDQEIETEQPK